MYNFNLTKTMYKTASCNLKNDNLNRFDSKTTFWFKFYILINNIRHIPDLIKKLYVFTAGIISLVVSVLATAMEM